MAKPRSCPHCQCNLPIGQGYRFDEQFNLICNGCGKVVFPTSVTTEPAPKSPRWDQQQSLLQVKPYGPYLDQQDPDCDTYQ